MSISQSTVGGGITATQTYIHDCFKCKEKQVWLNLGHYSKCENCGVIGTNDLEQCQRCQEWDYLFTIDST